eukprot:4055139-Heterocapsa_arctica.AAC.1
MSKTVIIHLWPMRLDAFRRTVLHDSFPAWRGVSLAIDGTYLGFSVGPGGHSRQWNKALLKYADRASH